MALVANYRAIKKDDADALLLAQRWSKYMAVTFAVGAVTGTVLTFEFGLLWPTFMGRFGAAFGIPFAFEGLFFFTEAIFIAIYIYGWKRLKPWPHFWTGVPIVIAGIGGTASVVAANSWMNEPAGFTLNSAGKVVDVDPWAVVFNKAMPYETAHMLVAAYLVGGFLIASVYAVAMLRGRRDRYHRLGFIIPFTVAAIFTPIQMIVGDQLARWVYNNEPVKFAALELVPKTSSDVPETIFGHLNSDGEVTGGLAIPGLASILSDPTTGTSTTIKGLDSFPTSDRPTTAEVNMVHLAWDVMVGLATLLFLLSAWYALAWLFRRDIPKTRLFLWLAGGAGVAAILALEAGWVVTEVGRQPWIVHNYLKVEQAATTNSGVWATFLIILGLYIGVGVTLVLVLRGMSRRWRTGQVDETRGPYEPSDPDPIGMDPTDSARGRMSDVVAVVLFVCLTAYALFGGADFGAGFWDLLAGGSERGRRPRTVAQRSIGPVWEANHVWLIFVLVVLWTGFPEAFESVTKTLYVPLSLAALGIVLRGSSFAFRKEVVRTSSQRNFGAAFAVSSIVVPFCMGTVAGAIASGHVPAGGKAGDPWSSWLNPTSILGGVLAVAVCAYLAAVYLVADSRRMGDTEMVEYFRRRAVAVAVATGIVAFLGVFILHDYARYVFDGLTSRALPLVVISVICGVGSLTLLVRDAPRGARLLAPGAVAAVMISWGVAQWDYILPTSLTVSQAAAPSSTLTVILVVFVIAAIVILPSFGLLYALDQKNVLDADSST